MAELISVIVVTYNREDALAAVLAALARQTDRGFEVVVADDGSGLATAALIAEWQGRLGVALKHVWHEDRGFRAAEIRNRAVLASNGSYFIFLDGDCIPRRNFIAAHRRLAERGWFVAGNRVLLSPALTERVLRHGAEVGVWRFGEFARERIRGGINRLAPLVSVPFGPLRRLTPGRWQGARTCNLAVWRADFEMIDGFDADFHGWGLEDSDLAIRLIHSGCRHKDGRFATGVLHLWHPEADRSRLAENELRFGNAANSGRVRALRGLSALPPPANGADAGERMPRAAGAGQGQQFT